MIHVKDDCPVCRLRFSRTGQRDKSEGPDWWVNSNFPVRGRYFWTNNWENTCSFSKFLLPPLRETNSKMLSLWPFLLEDLLLSIRDQIRSSEHPHSWCSNLCTYFGLSTQQPLQPELHLSSSRCSILCVDTEGYRIKPHCPQKITGQARMTHKDFQM